MWRQIGILFRSSTVARMRCTPTSTFPWRQIGILFRSSTDVLAWLDGAILSAWRQIGILFRSSTHESLTVILLTAIFVATDRDIIPIIHSDISFEIDETLLWRQIGILFRSSTPGCINTSHIISYTHGCERSQDRDK